MDDDDTQVYGDALTIAYQSGYYDGKKAAQRPWVGLTDEDMKKSWYDMENIMGWYSFQEVARAIEAKLKERNA